MKHCPVCETAYPNHHINCANDGTLLVRLQELEPGTLIRNKYRIVRKLGRGGMGTVYLADHILLGRQRALKFMSGELSHDPQLMNRFRMEAQAAMELRHPNVVEVVDLDQAEDDSPFIAMEYVEGPELRGELHGGALLVERALSIARGVALGLGAAHAKGIVHRDVKPENVLLSHVHEIGETPKLLDFGIAAMKDTSTTLSRTRGPGMTPHYAAPEQYKGLKGANLDGRVDLYALGGVLYEMLTGQTAFHSDSDLGWMYQHLEAERVRPSARRPELKNWAGLDEMVLRMLAVDREERQANIAEFLEELDVVRRRRAHGAFFHGRTETRREERRPTVVIPAKSSEDLNENAPVQDETTPKRLRSLWPVIIAGAALTILAVVALLFFERSKGAATIPGPLLAGTIRENPRDELKYAWIPPGIFEMGCSPGDTECQPQENPAHRVAFAVGFWIGQTPVTIEAWRRYSAATGAPALLGDDSLGRTNLNEAGSDEMPAVGESWEQAASFCHWAGMRLPTEAEWEYAARAGTRGSRYGDLNAIAWYADNSGSSPIDAGAIRSSSGRSLQAYEQRLKENGDFVHAPGQKQANAWQLYDMLGNVLEWTADWYSRSYYLSSPSRNPMGPPSGHLKTVRGASWADVASTVRVSNRAGVDPNGQFEGIGFRCAGSF